MLIEMSSMEGFYNIFSFIKEGILFDSLKNNRGFIERFHKTEMFNVTINLFYLNLLDFNSNYSRLMHVVRRHSNIQKKNIPPFSRPPSTILNLLMAILQLKIPSNIKI